MTGGSEPAGGHRHAAVGAIVPALPEGTDMGVAASVSSPPSPSGTAARRRTPMAAAHILIVLVALGSWQLLCYGNVLPRSSVASVAQIFGALGHMVATDSLWAALAATLETWALGLAISAAAGVALGVLLGASEAAYRSSRVTVDFMRNIPPVALVPLALLLYGATGSMVLFLIVFGAIWPVILQSMYGVHQVDPVVRDVVRSYRLSRWRRATAVVLPSAAPFIATGVRIAATMALLLAIGAELIGGAPGIGNSIAVAETAGNIAPMYAYIALSACLGVVINLALLGVERRLLSWHSAHRSPEAV
jgi:ABC-type nitrate/sulfonate/bicarbonate transport system permease component